MITQVEAVLTGRIAAFGNDGETSAIDKKVIAGKVAIRLLGLQGDEQADPVHHGGPDKAIHHYPHEHYATWRNELGAHPLLNTYGAFGENVATTGMAEGDLCIGDRYRLGTALVEVSQGRQPCWKLGHRFGNAGVTARVVATGRCGWYYRVIEAGRLAAGDRLELLDRPNPQWTVDLVFRLLVGRPAREQRKRIAALAQLPVLAESWRKRAESRSRTLSDS